MLLITLRDLHWRARRFVLAVLATSLVFSATLLLFGVHQGFLAESTRTVQAFDASAWLVPANASGPFTSNAPMPLSERAHVAALAGVRATTAVALYREVVRDSRGSGHQVNMIGYLPDSFVHPRLLAGRAPSATDEALANDNLGLHVGSLLSVSATQLRVVGLTRGITYYGGVGAMFVPLAEVLKIAFAGAPLASAILTQGTPRSVPAGLKAMRPAAVIADLREPLGPATTTIGVLSVLMLLVAAGIVGLMAYLSGLDRLMDFAVFKAIGVSGAKLVSSLVLQVVLLAISSALVAIAVANLLAPLFPIGVVLDFGEYGLLLAIALGVALCVSLVSVRQATAVDPALAFGRL